MGKGIILKGIKRSIDQKGEDSSRCKGFQELYSRIDVAVAVKLSSVKGSIKVIILD